MKLTKQQWEKILKPCIENEIEIIETPYGSHRFSFMPGTECEVNSEDLDIRGYFISKDSLLSKAPVQIQEDYNKVIKRIKKLENAVVEVAEGLGARRVLGEIFMDTNYLYYTVSDGCYQKKIVLFEGDELSVTKVDEIIKEINSDPHHPLYVKEGEEDFELYREALQIAYEVNLMDQNFVKRIENQLPIRYLEILLDDNMIGFTFTLWEDVKTNVDLAEKHGFERYKECVDIVEVLKYLEAE